ncbi:MAG: hypothetical protein SFX18_15870 [Pirellulales bacterium]|nr:hypothetical protein [Pirellulales bacterium]
MPTITFVRVLSLTSFLLGLGLIVHALLPRGDALANFEATRHQLANWVDAPSQQPVHLGTQTIETIQVGQRVISDDPTLQLVNATGVDPATWRKLRLTALQVWADGTRDHWEIVTLQPLTWIERHQLSVGVLAPIPLDLEEMGAPDDLRAVVASIEPCPVIPTGPGRVVLTTVNHLNPEIHELTFRDARQRHTSVQTTRHHKFFKPVSQTWHSTYELQPGDVVGGLKGDLTIVGNRRLPGVKRVYNLTVEGEHVYHVTMLGLLAHNNGCNNAQAIADHLVRDSPERFGRDRGSIRKKVEKVINSGTTQQTANGAIISHHSGLTVIQRPDGTGTMVQDPNQNTANNWLFDNGGPK